MLLRFDLKYIINFNGDPRKKARRNAPSFKKLFLPNNELSFPAALPLLDQHLQEMKILLFEGMNSF